MLKPYLYQPDHYPQCVAAINRMLASSYRWVRHALVVEHEGFVVATALMHDRKGGVGRGVAKWCADPTTNPQRQPLRRIERHHSNSRTAPMVPNYRCRRRFATDEAHKKKNCTIYSRRSQGNIRRKIVFLQCTHLQLFAIPFLRPLWRGVHPLSRSEGTLLDFPIHSNT